MKKEIFKKLRRIIVVSLPILCILLANILTNAHLKHFCVIKWITNHECVSCGMTRAFAALCRFDFQAAYEFNHLVYVYLAAAFLIWGLLLYFEFKNHIAPDSESSSE